MSPRGTNRTSRRPPRGEAREALERRIATATADGADTLRVELAVLLIDASEVEAALRCLDACRPEFAARSAAAQIARGNALRRLGRAQDAMRAYEAALAAAPGPSDAEHAVRASIMIGTIENQLGLYADAVARFRAAIAEATTRGLPALRVLGLVNLAPVLLRTDAPADAAACLDDALAASRRIGDLKYEATALRYLSFARTAAGRPDEALACAEQAVGVAERHGESLLIAQARHRLAEVHLAAGDADAALAQFAVCIEFARSHDETMVLCSALGSAARARLARGDAAGAETDAREALAVAETLSDLFLQAFALEPLARALELRGDVAAALAAERRRFVVVEEARGAESAARMDRLRSAIEGERALKSALDEVERLKQRLAAENAYLREEILESGGFDEIVGRSAALKRVLHRIGQVAPTEASVLVLGETGVGKELVAHAIHSRSPRKDRALVTVNCAALPAALIESELFGHEKGAFTGALARKVGRFELADGGTIFLDEIGELPLDLQAKLLRVLQSGEFERLGESRTRRTDARVVAATNRDLAAAVRAGTFRADLYYRIAVFEIPVPPLRERREDVPLLVSYFVSRFQAKLGKKIARIPDTTMRALAAYDWPGNVRELASVVQRGMILSPGDALVIDGAVGFPAASPAKTASADDSLDGAERAHIVRVLEACAWRVKGAGNAADRLGVPSSTLRSRMTKLGIVRAKRG